MITPVFFGTSVGVTGKLTYASAPIAKRAILLISVVDFTL